MPDYIPSPSDWVREQVELYERTNGTEGYTLRDTGMPVVIVTNLGNKTGGIRKTPLMRVEVDGTYVAVASKGGAPEHPQWYHNLKANPDVTVRDRDRVMEMRAREVTDAEERARLWSAAVEAYPPYAEYQERTERQIPVFALEPR
jgi:F420H(2)-dependent quinone reductase